MLPVRCHFLTVHTRTPSSYYLLLWAWQSIKNCHIIEKAMRFDKEQAESTKHLILEEIKRSTIIFRQKYNIHLEENLSSLRSGTRKVGNHDWLGSTFTLSAQPEMNNETEMMIRMRGKIKTFQGNPIKSSLHGSVTRNQAYSSNPMEDIQKDIF